MSASGFVDAVRNVEDVKSPHPVREDLWSGGGPRGSGNDNRRICIPSSIGRVGRRIIPNCNSLLEYRAENIQSRVAIAQKTDDPRSIIDFQ
jgi:hypothetical protein